MAEENRRTPGEALAQVGGSTAVFGTAGALIGGANRQRTRNSEAAFARKLRRSGSHGAARENVADAQGRYAKPAWIERNPRPTPWPTKRRNAPPKGYSILPEAGPDPVKSANYTATTGARRWASALRSRIPGFGAKAKGAAMLGGAAGATALLFGQPMERGVGVGVLRKRDDAALANAYFTAMKPGRDSTKAERAAAWANLEGMLAGREREMPARPAGSNELSAAELQQRRDAARARWANHTPKAETRAPAGPSAPRPWSGKALGLGRDAKVQASTMMAPTWRHNYDGREWGFDLPPQDQGGGRTYAYLKRSPQKPAGMSDAQFIELGRWAKGEMSARREDIIAEGLDGNRNRHTKPTIPRDLRDDREAIGAAFNHARLVAMHNLGIQAMPKWQFSEAMEPRVKRLERFMMRASRQMTNELRPQRAEVWAQIRKEYGREKGAYARDTLAHKAGETRYALRYHPRLWKPWTKEDTLADRAAKASGAAKAARKRPAAAAAG